MAKRGAGGAGSGQGSAKFTKGNSGSKKTPLLASNPFALLANQQEVPKKEKMPPFYVREIGGNLKADLDELIKRGLKATIKLCSDGYKVIVPSQQHYNAVEEYLRQKKAQYFTHDIQAKKPYKTVLRGLYDMDNEELKAHLTKLGLKVEAIHKIRRKQTNVKFRDQLYLVHLENGSTSLKDLQTIRAVANVIVVWEKYQPVHRDVTQCTRCFNFGHGTRNCHMKPRCEKCGGDHDAAFCVTDVLITKCCNCDGDHPSTDRTCPKRVEFVQMRRAAAARRAPKKQANLNPADFPAVPQPKPRYVVPNLEPLPPNYRVPGSGQNQQNPAPGTSQQNPAPGTNQQNPAPGNNNQPRVTGKQNPPGFRTYSQVTTDGATGPGAAAEEELFTATEMMDIFHGLMERLQSCKTKKDQFEALCKYSFEILYGP